MFLTSPGAPHYLKVTAGPPVRFICAASDGLDRVAIRYADWSAYEPFFTPIETVLREQEPAIVNHYLGEFLASERLAAKTQDDLTFVVAAYDAQATPFGA